MKKPVSKEIPKNIICISSVDWFPIPTRKQQVMSRLPKDYNVLYIEPPSTLLSPIKDKKMTFKLTEYKKGNKRISDCINAYCPPPVLPFGNVFKWINSINQRWTSIFIKAAAKRAGIENPLIWTYMPNSYELINQLDFHSLIYDCVDEHSEYKGFIKKEAILDMERALIEKCDVVFVTTKGLHDSKSKYNKNTYLIPNGANFQLFNEVQNKNLQENEEVSQIPKPIVGFIGVIQEWIDLDLIYKMAKENSDWSVLMVGPIGVGIDVEPLKELANVYFVGRKNPEELPGYIKAFDVCINPFRQSDLTKNVSPLKFYEYLATGKPIVTVDMPSIREFSDCVLIAKDDNDFIDKVKEAIDKDTEDLKSKRIIKGKESAWERKVEEMLGILANKLGGNSDDK